jgi:hypothetical protein
MPKIVCVKDETEYRIEKSGAYVIEYFGIPPHPYKIWMYDGWKCPKCGHVIMAGHGDGPISEHFEPDFNDILNNLKEGKLAKEGWLINDYELAALQG